jgi:hypothetical protein
MPARPLKRGLGLSRCLFGPHLELGHEVNRESAGHVAAKELEVALADGKNESSNNVKVVDKVSRRLKASTIPKSRCAILCKKAVQPRDHHEVVKDSLRHLEEDEVDRDMSDG